MNRLGKSAWREYATEVQPGDIVNGFKIRTVSEEDEDGFLTFEIENQGVLKVFKNSLVEITRDVCKMDNVGFSRNEMKTLFDGARTANDQELAYKIKKTANEAGWDIS